MKFTEKDAAIAYAKAWNRLDCSEFIKLLAEDACYASQKVLEELEDKNAISDYFIKKVEAVRVNDAVVHAELGITREGFIGRDCVFLSQGKKEEIQAAVLFEIDSGKIKRYDLCLPELLNVERSGVYPI